ncbi:MAG: nuclear transport factor 2 family protein [Candidatus Lustribacter sp.]|jgi:limonene-1,2-epoxide hydrolase
MSSAGPGPEDAVIRFTACFDARDIEGMAQWFADDGVWKRPDGDIVGIAGLRAFMNRRSPGVFTRHVISNVRTTVEDGSAVVDSYVTVYRHDFAGLPVLPAPLDAPDVVGRYRDVLVKENGTWKLSLRESIVEFKR